MSQNNQLHTTNANIVLTTDLPQPSSSTTMSSPLTSSSMSLLDDLHKWPKEIRNILAGGIAGIMAKTVVAPVDRIKILYQVSAAEFHLSKIPSVVGNIVRNEGARALWKGNSATLIRVFPYSGIQFMVYERIKTFYLHRHENVKHASSSNNKKQNSSNQHSSKNFQLSPLPRNNSTSLTLSSDRKHGLSASESLIAGMTAGVVSVLCTYPLDVTRAQLAVLKKNKYGPNKGFISVIRDNFLSRGIPGLFRGVSVTLIGILPYSGIAFTLNEQSKREIQHVTGRELLTMERLLCGAFAGLIAQSVTYPIEVTRRRMQTIGLLGKSSETALSAVESTNIVATTQASSSSSSTTLRGIIRNLYLEQGIRGFFKGVAMNWIKGPVAFSISFTTFDFVQNALEAPLEKSQRLSR